MDIPPPLLSTFYFDKKNTDVFYLVGFVSNLFSRDRSESVKFQPGSATTGELYARQGLEKKKNSQFKNNDMCIPVSLQMWALSPCKELLDLCSVHRLQLTNHARITRVADPVIRVGSGSGYFERIQIRALWSVPTKNSTRIILFGSSYIY